MNLTVVAPEWLALTLVALLLAAAIEDSIRLRISNLTCIGVLIAALIAMAVVGLEWAFWQNFAVFAGLLAIGMPIFAAGKLGGGDVKLLATTGMWFDFTGAFTMLINVLLAGGLLALIILALRLFRWSEAARARVELLRPRGGIPYGLAISSGAILAMTVGRGWG